MTIGNPVFQLGCEVDLNLNSIGIPLLMKEAIESGNTLYKNYWQGNIGSDAKHKMLTKIEEVKLQLIYQSSSQYLFKTNDSIIDLNISGNNLSINVASFQKNTVDNLISFAKSLYVHQVPVGQVYAVVKSGNTIHLSSLGNAGIPLVRKNYSENSIKDFDFVVQDLCSRTPSGRIVILQGSPGTGKTHLVRALPLLVPEAMFVLISPEMVPLLSGPEFLPVLLNNRKKGSSIILILEDADRCLVSRNEKNMNDIQALLNLGDGIIGSMLDIRIIATTNAKKMEFEEALTRKGRLSKIINIDKLPKEDAWKLLNFLLGEQASRLGEHLPEEMSLGDVYSLARDHGWLPLI
jgi:hypothetical protein